MSVQSVLLMLQKFPEDCSSFGGSHACPSDTESHPHPLSPLSAHGDCIQLIPKSSGLIGLPESEKKLHVPSFCPSSTNQQLLANQEQNYGVQFPSIFTWQAVPYSSSFLPVPVLAQGIKSPPDMAVDSGVSNNNCIMNELNVEQINCVSFNGDNEHHQSNFGPQKSSFQKVVPYGVQRESLPSSQPQAHTVARLEGSVGCMECLAGSSVSKKKKAGTCQDCM
jgi:hypothetical protein